MRLVFVVIPGLALAIGACSAASLAGRPTLSPALSPTLRAASDYVEGQVAALNAQCLFVEYFVVNNGVSLAAECPEASMIDFPGYSFSDGVLTVQPAPLPDGLDIVGYAGFGQANTGAMGGGISSQLELISGLPYALPYKVAIVHALEPTGEIVVEVGGGLYRMAPGESWTRTDESDPTPDCHRTTTVRFTNFGLLERSQIK